ncbi:Fe-S-containing hydro-lyase [Clostridium sp.]
MKNVLSESFLHKKIPRAHKIDLEENMDRTITAPIDRETLKSLHAGDYVYISGTIYTARDAAHKRMIETLDEGRELPLDLKDNVIYYMGPSPAREGRPIGSAGPTTASRMDKYTPRLLDLGMGAMIGKGKRSQAVIDAIVRNGAVYFAAVGGAGAILSKCIKESEVIAYDDLGTEAIRKLMVENMPMIVVIDSEGNNLYETAVKEYQR